MTEQNKNEIKLPGLWEVMLVFLGAFLLTNVLILTVAAILQPEVLEDTSILATSKWYLILSQLIILILPVIYFRYRQFNLAELFRIKKIDGEMAFFTFLMALGLLPVLDEVDRLVQMFIPSDELDSQIREVLQTNSTLDFMLLAVTLVILAPLFEEFIFRGALQQGFEKRLGIMNGIIFTSVFWAFIHQVMSWAIQIFILGLVLGVLAYRYRSVLSSIIIHAVYNLFSLISYNSQDSTFMSQYENEGHVEWIWLVTGAVLLFISGKKLFAEPRQNS